MKRWLLLAVVASGCGGLSVSAFQDAARAAKACDPKIDTCRNAGGSQCLCATPVNSMQAAEIDNLAKDVACGGARVSCAPMLNPRCVNGTCVGDTQ